MSISIPTCEAAYGLPREQVVGRTLEEVLGDGSRRRFPLHHLRECVRTGELAALRGAPHDGRAHHDD